ncbi:hypothetical protein LZ496_01980 [Sphingomonas sp. NSE70-1]|uniref:SH3 domain-containing protein n=1 Tax=Sphingomonas caseinilyticus TaxID=2908205 RepID=A0ABT0RRB3_9SPHN|nr:hypothetical protein [Sphingomonas caseinilyticus]MCL6697554.1 hypothetical protein [Sphingomonas caseinilyticus]
MSRVSIRLESMNVVFLFAALQAAQAEPARAPIVDDCDSDASFAEYRISLAKAVASKDKAALRQLVDPEISVDLGGGSGWPALVEAWGLDGTENSALWAELAEVLALGCGEYQGQKIMPGNFSSLGEFEGFPPPYFSISQGAALRSEPSDMAPVRMLLDNHILLEQDNWAPEGWLHARLTNGQTGYVRLHAVRNAIDYRATFERRNGKWLMTSFLAGD